MVNSFFYCSTVTILCVGDSLMCLYMSSTGAFSTSSSSSADLLMSCSSCHLPVGMSSIEDCLFVFTTALPCRPKHTVLCAMQHSRLVDIHWIAAADHVVG